MRSLTITAILLAVTGAAHAEEAKYKLDVKAEPAAVKKNAGGQYRITITPAPGFVLKVETPFKATLVASDGLKVDKAQFSSSDFEDAKSPAKSVVTTYVGTRAGAQSIEADLSFFICNDELCERFKAKPKVAIDVKE